MQRTKQRDTPGELALRSALTARGLRYRVHVSLPVTRRHADVGFIGARLAVFIDGCFWHGCPSHGTWPKANGAWWRAKILANVARDRDTDARLKAAGWLVLRFWDHHDAGRAANRIERLLARLAKA